MEAGYSKQLGWEDKRKADHYSRAGSANGRRRADHLESGWPLIEVPREGQTQALEEPQPDWVRSIEQARSQVRNLLA